MGDPEYIASRPYSGSPDKSYNTSDIRRIYTVSIRLCEVSKHPPTTLIHFFEYPLNLGVLGIPNTTTPERILK